MCLRGWRWTTLYGKKGGREARRQNEMVCCQRSGKNDPEQIAASFPQTTRREEGRRRRWSRRRRWRRRRRSTDFPHSAYDIRNGRPRPPAMTVVGRLALLAAHGDQNIVACFMGSLIGVVCLAGRVGRSRSTVHQIGGNWVGSRRIDRQFPSNRSRSQYSLELTRWPGVSVSITF